jgi:hypothetical protein
MMREGKLPTVHRQIPPGHDKISSLLLANPAYTLLPYCMNEFTNCNTNEEVIFNNLLRSSRNQIECAFGCLKATWQILNTKMNLKLENVPGVIYASLCNICIYNFCSLNGILVDDDSVQRQITHDIMILTLFICATVPK